MATTLEPERLTGGGAPDTPSLSRDRVPAWLRVWAWLTVAAALPLAVLGAETTTRAVGMADTVSLRSPWYFFTLPLSETSRGLLIEHGHRQVGWAVGLLSIVLAVGMRFGATGWRRSLGWLALIAVSVQGILGILRVRWNVFAGPELAAFHGCFAQLTFAVLVAVAVMTTRAFADAPPLDVRRPLWGSAVGLAAAVYLLIVFGALVRHLQDPIAQRLHVLLAFAVVVKVFWLAGRLHATAGPSRRVAVLLAVLVAVQPILGVEAWIRRFGAGTIPELLPPSTTLDLVRSGHHLLGTVIFTTAVALAVLVWRQSVALAVAAGREGAA